MKSKTLCKRKTLVHSIKESNWDEYHHMVDEGLMEGWSEAKKDRFTGNYVYTNLEVTIELEVYEDGTSEIIAVDGMKVLRKPKQRTLSLVP